LIHLITLSGNSQRFIDKGYPHKSLLDINGRTSLKVFIDLIPDFSDYKTLFLCRNDDLTNTSLRQEIQKHSQGKILGIDRNTLGPLYSISQVLQYIPDSQPLMITYIDSLQKCSITDMLEDYGSAEGGLTIHGLDHPHWKHNRYFCFVRHDQNGLCQEVIEKYNFNGIDFNNPKGMGGSSGSYYFKSGELYKKYSSQIIKNNQTINKEFYVTQIFQEMIKDGLTVKGSFMPYGNLGTPEDVEEYVFWENWFK